MDSYCKMDYKKNDVVVLLGDGGYKYFDNLVLGGIGVVSECDILGVHLIFGGYYDLYFNFNEIKKIGVL